MRSLFLSLRVLTLLAVLVFALAVSACRSQPFDHVPDIDRDALHLRFVVQQPSKVDFLFVVGKGGTGKTTTSAALALAAAIFAAFSSSDSFGLAALSSPDFCSSSGDFEVASDGADVVQVTTGDRRLSGFAFSSDGATVAYAIDAPAAPATVAVYLVLAAAIDAGGEELLALGDVGPERLLEEVVRHGARDDQQEPGRRG